MKTERRIITGKVQGYSREITKFPGKRGSRGVNLDTHWHNVLGSLEYLNVLESKFPVHAYVRFVEKRNKRGYWDIVEDSIKKITKKEALAKDKDTKLPEPEETPAPPVIEEIEINEKNNPDIYINKSRVKKVFDDLLSEWKERGGDVANPSFDRIPLHQIYKKAQELGIE